MKLVHILYLCLAVVCAKRNTNIDGLPTTVENSKPQKNVYTFLGTNLKTPRLDDTKKQTNTLAKLNSNHLSVLVQSYINATKFQVPNNIHSTNHFQNGNIRKAESKQLNQHNSTSSSSHYQQAEKHLKALKNVIALQLLSYKSKSEDTKVKDSSTIKSVEHKETTKENMKSKKRDIFHEDLNKGMYKKLAVIAAAEALMKILDA